MLQNRISKWNSAISFGMGFRINPFWLYAPKMREMEDARAAVASANYTKEWGQATDSGT